ncbi:MAG: tandem-95 repeat protein, partial [Anaerolineales bacterium]|nr:tandem-95 repeat protein [Anaerolineales bacterium]
MLKKFNMTLILSALLIALTSTAALAAPPPLPSSFYGTVQLSGADVPPGTIISAWIGDVEYVSTVGFLDGDRSVFVLDVPGDDPDTPGIEGGVDGDSIVFQVAGFNADQTAIWEGGTHVELNLTATPPPLPPIADDQNLVTDEDTPLAITLTALDPNNDPLTFSIVSDPSNGTLSGTPPDLIYTPAPDFNGADSFTFVANDGTFDSNVATISITVNPINDAPRLDPIADQVMDEGETRDLGVVAVDPDGDTITLSAAGLPAFASFSDEGGGFGILSLTPGFDDAGVYPDVTISASDGTLVSTRMFTITVNDVIPLPRARFSVGKPSNVARSSDGASIVDFSSVWSASTSHQPENAIDNNVSSAWSTGSGQVTDQWIKVQLTGGEPHVVDRVVLRGSSSNNGIKNFEIRVSTTGTADADFTTVLVESLPQDNEFHEFTFAPTSAAYIQLFILDNWGSGSNIGVRHFEVWTRDREGGIVSLFEGPPASIAGVSSESSVGTRAELAIDLSSSSIWRTAQGQTTDQWIKVELGGGLIYTIGGVRLQSSSTIEAARDFEIRVSTTTADDGAFTTVFTATGAATTDLQEFSFAPVQARFVQLFIRNNNGSSCCVRVGMFQVLTPDGANVSRLEGVGASVVDASSWSGFSSRPDLAIDYPTNTRWQTATGAVTDQWIKVRLIEGAPYLINKVMLDSPPGNVSPRVFEIRVSNATLDDADFTTVLTATLPSDGLAHWFSLPQVEAKYVQLFIRDNRGSNVIQVERFQVFSPELGGAVVPFDDLSQHPDGEIVAWDWDFGDSTGSTTQHPVHTFLGPGTYPVSLTVTDGVGNTDTTNMDYSVLLPPTVDFTWSPLEPDEGQTTALSGSAADEDGIIVAWRWTFSHSTTVRTTQDTSTSFPDNGDYVVDLTVTDSQLLTSISTQGITALNAPPSVSVPDKTVYFGEAVRVTPNVSEPGTADRTTLAYLWDLGDGNTYDQKVINYVYATVGVYDVSLTVTDKDGGVGSDTATFIVEKRPTTLIYVGARSGEDGQPVRLRAKLRDDPSGGDGISGKTIQFTLGTQTTSAVTDDRGIAETNLIFSGGSGLYTVTATFVEDDAYLGSSDTETFAVAGLFPSTITATLAPGESVTEIKRGVIPRAFKLADILLAFDTTGSMRGVINKAKAQGVDIVEDLSGLIEDGRFAVISHGDYPGLFESFGYRATYGASSDFPYRLDQPLTGDTALVVNAINGIRGTQGADGPESYVTVMYESVAELVGDPNPTEGVLGYRLESKKILIHFHDNIPHDNNLNEGVPGKTGTSTTGGEPGRNGVIDETSDPDRIGPPYNDDLNLQTVLDLMANNGVTMIPVRTGLSQRIYWEHWAELTGGSVVFMSSGSVAVSDAVREAVEREASEVDRVTLTVSAGFEDWVTFSPSEYLNVITPIELSFEVTITPPADTLPGTYDFTISLVGDGFEYALQTVVIEVGGNDAPIAQDDAYEVDEDSPLTVPVPGVLVNDSDPDGDPLTAVLVDDVLNGSLSLNEDGSFEYVPDPDYNGPESFTYRANDGELDSEIATVSITVNPVNDPPVADDQAVTTDEDTSVGITLAGSDVDGDALTYSVVDAPASGTLSGTAPDLTYTPNPDYNGPDSFTFKV